MTAGRWFGPRLIDRYGRVPVLRACSIVALVGLVLVVYSQLLHSRSSARCSWVSAHRSASRWASAQRPMIPGKRPDG